MFGCVDAHKMSVLDCSLQKIKEAASEHYMYERRQIAASAPHETAWQIRSEYVAGRSSPVLIKLAIFGESDLVASEGVLTVQLGLLGSLLYLGTKSREL